MCYDFTRILPCCKDITRHDLPIYTYSGIILLLRLRRERKELRSATCVVSNSFSCFAVSGGRNENDETDSVIEAADGHATKGFYFPVVSPGNNGRKFRGECINVRLTGVQPLPKRESSVQLQQGKTCGEHFYTGFSFTGVTDPRNSIELFNLSWRKAAVMYHESTHDLCSGRERRLIFFLCMIKLTRYALITLFNSVRGYCASNMTMT